MVNMGSPRAYTYPTSSPTQHRLGAPCQVAISRVNVVAPRGVGCVIDHVGRVQA
ncbi:MAG: hypothetical protein ACD_23C01072G0004 [uncultured bacterium]|nr:MAG: hypothetical protein ACD_23C01072G0004 [uncultured bacterium]